jgi:hypothetical protein
MHFSNYYSDRLRQKIAKKAIPKRLIICHGRKCQKRSFLGNRKKIYLDYRSSIDPDVNMNIHDVYKHKPVELKSKFKYMTSIYAPLNIFFNKNLSYIDFVTPRKNLPLKYRRYKSIFHNKKREVSKRKILKSDISFNNKFLLSLLYLLKIGGTFEFTDNFIFEDYFGEKSKFTDEDGIQIVKKFLGNKVSYFDVFVTSKSNCIDYQEKAKERQMNERFVAIKKTKEYFK